MHSISRQRAATVTVDLPRPGHPRQPGAGTIRPLAAAGLVVLSTALFSATPALADKREYLDSARVVDVRPAYRRVVEPHRQCTREIISAPAPVRHHGSTASPARLDATGIAVPVIGGIAGGMIGSRIGDGSGRTAATVAGAIAGTLAGAILVEHQSTGRADPRVHDAYRPVMIDRVVERCRTVNVARDVADGYDVTYRYQGRLFTSRMAHDPGRFVHVSVTRARGGSDRRAERRDRRQDDYRVVIIDDRRQRGH